jgi:hypothetical protein
MNKNVNYIVSGIERSGTSLMMQILEAGGLPVVYDDSRKPDEHNPKGYYELEGGKIIDALSDGKFPMKKYRGKFIKITAWGLEYLPKGKYNIIYMIRSTDEIVESTIKMTKENYNKEELGKCLAKFDRLTLEQLKKKVGKDFILLPIFFNSLVRKSTSKQELEIIKIRFPEFDVDKAIKVIDEKLYRSRG